MTFMQMTENYMLSPTSDHRHLTTPVTSHGERLLAGGLDF